MTQGEKRAGLEGQFDESLSGFDEQLKEEQGDLGERRQETDEIVGSRTDPVSSSGSYGSSSDEGEQGTEPGDSGGGQYEGDESQTAQGKTDNSRRPGGSRGAPAPAEIPDGHDDDIVARQLREAAESEEDPELSAKLWEEYLNYKRGGKPRTRSSDDDSDDSDDSNESKDKDAPDPSEGSGDGDSDAGSKGGEGSDA
jgi:hypothetical protein